MSSQPGVVTCHCIYSIHHLSRDAAGRTPTSSAAYQAFSAVADLTTLGLYAFSAFTTHNESDGWSNRLSGRQDLTNVFVPVVYYAMVVVGGLQLVSLCLSLWLAWAFRKISLMPPDMNPLEDNLTARPKHKRNKSSMTTLSSTESDKRLSTPLGNLPRSEMSYGDPPRAPTVPFMHTREGSNISLGSKYSRVDLPSRQYQIIPGNSPRNSAISIQPKCMPRPLSAVRSAYAEVPLDDHDLSTTGNKPGTRQSVDDARVGKFTETWLPTDSLVSRTNQRNRNAAAALRTSNRNSAPYAALSQRYDIEDSSDSECDDENVAGGGGPECDLSQGHHPNPLRSNPLQGSRTITSRAQTLFRPQGTVQSADSATLSEVSHNCRRVSQSKDIADETTSLSEGWHHCKSTSSQLGSQFYSKPYGELKCATPPIMVGDNRKISSGNDYESGKYSSDAYERRNVSGKVAEEGRAGNRYSKYGLYTGRTTK